MSGRIVQLAFYSAILLLWCSGVKGQNLISHGGFENFTKYLEYDFGHKVLENNPTTWHNPTRGRPEVYYDPKTAKSGDVFMGCHMIGIAGYREYISTPLRCRLLAGDQYVLRFYVKLSENSEFATSSFGALLSDEKVTSKYTNRLKDTPQVFVDNTDFFLDRRAWTIVEDTFTATGNESYLTIGNFLDDESTITKKVKRLAQQGKAYYYIDDVTLFSIDDRDPCKVLVDSSKCESVTISELNIVPDPSFECFDECPAGINTQELTQLTYWKQTSTGTPDYYNSCSIIMSVPENIMGKEDAHTGEGYVGMYLFDRGNYREYITAKLAQPMIKKKWYVVTLWAALSDNSRLATDAFEFMVSENDPDFESDSADIDKLKPQVINTPGNYADKYTWQKICGVYLAEGGEQFITMGNFKVDAETNLKQVKNGSGGFAYYFIDDFTVEPLTASNMTECGAGIAIDDIPKGDIGTPPRFYEDLSVPQLVSGKPFTFKGFFFEFDKYEIIDSNYAYLDSLVDMMYDDDHLTIQVHGHTDYVGNNRYNQKLSKNRALVVVDYLVKQGIDKDRITYEYFGATRPVATNLTDEGRQKNRRVEFILNRG